MPDVDDGQCVGLLQGHVRGAAIRTHGDVLRLQILADRDAGADVREQPHAHAAQHRLFAVEAVEVGGTHRALLVDDADGAFGVHVAIGFALVGDQCVSAVRRECDHVRQGADFGLADRLADGIEHHYPTGQRLVGVLHGGRDHPILHRHAVGATRFSPIGVKVHLAEQRQFFDVVIGVDDRGV